MKQDNNIKNKNKAFTAGEESILEDACKILQRRKIPFYSKEYHFKKLIFIHSRGFK